MRRTYSPSASSPVQRRDVQSQGSEHVADGGYCPAPVRSAQIDIHVRLKREKRRSTARFIHVWPARGRGKNGRTEHGPARSSRGRNRWLALAAEISITWFCRFRATSRASTYLEIASSLAIVSAKVLYVKTTSQPATSAGRCKMTRAARGSRRPEGSYFGLGPLPCRVDSRQRGETLAGHQREFRSLTWRR